MCFTNEQNLANNISWDKCHLCFHPSAQESFHNTYLIKYLFLQIVSLFFLFLFLFWLANRTAFKFFQQIFFTVCFLSFFFYHCRNCHYLIRTYFLLKRTIFCKAMNSVFCCCVQLLCHVWFFEASWTAACQASLSFAISQILLTHVHWINNAIQPCHLLSLPSLPTLNLSQHQDFVQWVGSLNSTLYNF